MHTAGKRILSAVLAVVIAVTTVPGGMGNPVVVSAATDHTLAAGSNLLIARGSGDHKITGAGSAVNAQIVVESNYVGTIELDNVEISTTDRSPIVVEDWADVTFVLKGANTLTATASGNTGYPGLLVSRNAKVTITGDGSLKAESIDGYYGAAGIGGDGGANYTAGTITINMDAGGSIEAIGGGTYYTGAGIGGGASGSGGTITIKSGKVDAKGGGDDVTNTSSAGAAGIGGGGDMGGGGNITIEGGEITAEGGKLGSGIGGGANGGAGNIRITGGEVTAKGSDASGANGVGIGSGANAASSGEIFIGGKAKVTATGSGGKPDIGQCAALAVLPGATVTTASAGGYAGYNKFYYLNVTQLSGTPATSDFTATTVDKDDPKGQSIPIYVKLLDFKALQATGVRIGDTGTNDPAVLDGLYYYKTANMTNVTYFSNHRLNDKLVYGETEGKANGTTYEVVLPAADTPTYSLVATNSTIDLGKLTYGYTRAQARDTGTTLKTFTVKNAGDQWQEVSVDATELADIRKIFELTGDIVDAPSFQGTSIPAGGTATIEVSPCLYLDAGKYEEELTFTSKEGATATVTIVFEVEPLVDADNKAVKVTADPLPNGGPPSNQIPMGLSSVKLTAEVDQDEFPKNTFNDGESWYYIVTKAASAPADTDPGWRPVTTTAGSTISDVNVDLSGLEGQYYIHWRANTKNTTGTTGTIEDTTNGKIYFIDNVAPTTKLERANNETNSVGGPFDVWVTFTENNFENPFVAPALTAVTVTSSNATVTAIGTPVFIPGTPPQYRVPVTITPDPSISEQADITITVPQGAILDAALNDSEASNELKVPYDARTPSVVFGEGFGKVYPKEPDQNASFTFTVTHNNSQAGLYYDGVRTEPVISDLAKAFIFTRKDSQGITTTLTADTHFRVGYLVLPEGVSTFVIQPPLNGTFTEGEYNVEIKDHAFYNYGGIGVLGISGTFDVKVPTITSITPEYSDYDSGDIAKFTIQGTNLDDNIVNSLVLGLGHNGGSPNFAYTVTPTINPDEYVIECVMPVVDWQDPVETHTYTAWIRVLTQDGMEETDSGLSASVQVHPAKKFEISLSRAPDTVPPLHFAYSDVSAQEQTVTIRNTGNQAFTSITTSLTSSADFTIDASSLAAINAGNPFEPGGELTVVVRPNTGLTPSQTAYETTINVTATGTDSATGMLLLAPQAVLDANNPAIVLVTPSDTPTNGSKTLTIQNDSSVPPAAQFDSGEYQFTAPGDNPNSANWTPFTGPTATATTPDADGLYTIHWKLTKPNVTTQEGYAGPYHFDRGAPTVVDDNGLGTHINQAGRKITFTFTDTAWTAAYNPSPDGVFAGFDSDALANIDDTKFLALDCTPIVIESEVAVGNGGQTLTVPVWVTPDNPSGTISFQLDAGFVKDLAGNPSAASNTHTPIVDNVRPDATLSATTPTNASPIPVTLTFDKAVTATAAEIEAALVVTNGTVGSVTGSGTTFTFNVTPAGVGTVTVAFPENTVFDSALNGNVGDRIYIDFDNETPKAILSTADNGSRYRVPFDVIVDFNGKRVTGLTSGTQFAVTGGSAGTPSAELGYNDSRYRITVTPSSNPYSGQITVQLKHDRGNIVDVYTNIMDADSNILDVQFDNTPLSVSLSTGKTKVNGPFTVEVEFDKDVDAAQLNANLSNIIDVTDGSVGSLVPSTGEGKRYTVTITPNSGTGTATIEVPANTVKDSFGNFNTVSNPLSIDYSDQVPFVTYDNLNDGDIFLRSLQSFTITASEDLYTDEAATLPVGANELNSALRFTRDGAAVTTTVTKAGNVFTIGSSFGPGRYSVGIPAGNLYNEFGTGVPASSRSFEVWDPTVQGLSASPETLPSAGGDTVLTVSGMFLGDFGSLQVVRLGASSYPVANISGVYGQTGTATATLPASPTVYDEEYEFEVYADGSPTGIRTTVRVAGKGRPVIRSIAAQPNWLPYTGGTANIVLSGEDLQNLPLSLTVSGGLSRGLGVHDIPIGNISTDGTSATLPIGFSGSDADHNTIYTVEANVDGAGTGATTTVLVGSLVTPFVHADNPMVLDIRSRYNQTGGITISLGMSDESVTVAQRASVSVENANVASISTRSVEDTIGSVEVRSQRKGSTNVHVTFYDYDGNVMPEYGTTIQVQVIDDYKYGTDGPGGGGGGGQDGDRGGGSPSTWWIELPEARELVDAARQRGADKIPYRRYSLTGIRLESAHHMKGYTFYHDTIDEDGNVLVRITLAQPELVTHDTILTGYVGGSHVNDLKRKFDEWFPNKLRIISMEEPENFGLRVELAAKLDMSGFDMNNLYLYSYDAASQVLTRVQDPEFWMDGNSFLHFYTQRAGDLIVSEGALIGTDVIPEGADDMENPSTGGGVNPYLPAFLVYLGARDAQDIFVGILKGLGVTSVVLLAGVSIWAVTPKKRDKRFRIKR